MSGNLRIFTYLEFLALLRHLLCFWPRLCAAHLLRCFFDVSSCLAGARFTLAALDRRSFAGISGLFDYHSLSFLDRFL